jgi:thiamine biosynthesis lipoprotein
MGTLFQITLYAPEEAVAARANKAAFARVAELDAMMSDYRRESELMRLCSRSGGPPVPVSGDLFTVLDRAQNVSRRSGGAFDVTVGPAVRLWRRARRTQLMPDPDDLAQVRALVGYDKMRLDPLKKTVQLTKPGMQLDLGGIAKGFAADQALAVLKKRGMARALVVAGGEVVMGCPPPGAAAWVVGIAPLDNPQNKPHRNLLLQNAAVSTSGDAEQFVEIGGKRYSHLLDPRTGIGLVGRSSVTVVAPDGLTADSLTKVVAVLGPEKGFPIVEETPGAACLVVRKTDRGEEVIASPRFAGIPQRTQEIPGKPSENRINPGGSRLN